MTHNTFFISSIRFFLNSKSDLFTANYNKLIDVNGFSKVDKTFVRQY